MEWYHGPADTKRRWFRFDTDAHASRTHSICRLFNYDNTQCRISILSFAKTIVDRQFVSDAFWAGRLVVFNLFGVCSGHVLDNCHISGMQISYRRICRYKLQLNDVWLWRFTVITQSIENTSILRPSFADVFLLVIGATCQQGSSATPRSLTARITMVIIFIAMMFLFVSYSANIVALLQSPSSKIRTLEDLHSSRLEVGAEDTSYNKYLFAVSAYGQKELASWLIYIILKETNRSGS